MSRSSFAKTLSQGANMQSQSDLPAGQNLAQLHDCWQRLADWSPDDPLSANPFSARLAKESGWSQSFALRAIEEYKRFVFLSVVAEHVVCPSEEVDQVWHMHLTFTVSYWNDLCGQIINRPLHHHPSKGGQAEHSKHVALYEQTLASYRHWFGQEPPQDLWPRAARRFEDDQVQRVSRRHYWLLPKPAPRLWSACGRMLERAHSGDVPQLWKPRRWIGCSGVLAIVPIAAAWNPLDQTGQEFLALYGTLLATICVAGPLVRMALWPEENELTEDLTHEEIACVKGDYRLAVNAALARLIYEQVVQIRKVDSNDYFSTCAALPDDATALEAALFARICQSDQVTLSDLHLAAGTESERIESSLRERGWLTPASGYALAARFVPFFLTMCIAILGVAKVAVGLSRGKPVLFLIGGLVVTILIALAFLHRPRVTRPAKRWLKEQRRQNQSLKKLADMPEASSNDFALATALFGAAALHNTVCEPLRTAWVHNRSTAGSSGCGADGCGGGGGGGGCGGSGCGGCGGGGD